MSRLGRRQFLELCGGATLFSYWDLNCGRALMGESAGPDHWQEGLVSLPQQARPWVYWYWMDGLVTKEGITADLGLMKDAGIGGAYLMTIGPDSSLLKPPISAGSPEFWQMVKHAMQEAARLDMQIAVADCDGWATAGGPWIEPELAQQKVVWSVTQAEGGREFDRVLPAPPQFIGTFQDSGGRPLPANEQIYRDIGVLAFPTPEGFDVSTANSRCTLTSNIPELTPAVLAQLIENKAGAPSVQSRQPGYIQIAFEEPFTCRSITFRNRSMPFQANRMELQVSDDGEHFSTRGRLEPPQHGWGDSRGGVPSTQAVPEVTARYFRLVYDPTGTDVVFDLSKSTEEVARHYKEWFDNANADLVLSGLEISSAPRIHHFEGKAGYAWRRASRTTTQQVPDRLCVPLNKVLDLTSKMDSHGHLQCRLPAGRWTILRAGYTPTGAKNGPAGGATGLECDKFNPAAVEQQLQGWLGKAFQAAGASIPERTFSVAHIDSWECGCQNWSPVFLDEFRQRRKYDPVPYMPAMAGIPVESADASERFLWDVRETISELISENFFGPLHKYANAHGCKLSAEAVAPIMPADGMLHHAHTDIPMGEFWWQSAHNDKPTDCREAISASHVYGKQIAQMEAFTTAATTWDEHPFQLKALADHNFCLGANRYVCHVYTSQAWPDRVPGVTLGRVGQFFTGHQTWWKPGRAWVEYLTRCQYLLQQGQFAADVCYFTGEESPRRALLPEQLHPPLPAGYQYDSINPHALLTRLSAADGKVLLPDGNSYTLLVLPGEQQMRLEVAEKVQKLVAAGAIVFGAPPARASSLEGGISESDGRLRKIVNELWGDCDGVGVKAHRYGKGKVVAGGSLQTVLADAGIGPEFVYEGAAGIEYTHRRSPEYEMYFISNQTQAVQSPKCSFRVSGRVPQFLYPDSGRTIRCANFTEENARTLLDLKLEPYESVFLFFPASGKATDHVRVLRRNGKEIATPANLGELDTGIWLSEDGALTVQATEAGVYEISTAAGRVLSARVEKVAEPFNIRGDWVVEFQPNRGAPKQITLNELQPWTAHPDAGVRYYSGTATYRLRFSIPASLVSSGQELYVDLGDVRMLAEVRLNGKKLGIAWKPPYVVKATSVLQMENLIEIEVSNVWKNRLIGDSDLSQAERVTWVADDGIRKNPVLQPHSPLATSGLLGPVVLRSMGVAQFGEK